MPETTETTTLPQAPEQAFAQLADFSRLAEWDPMFERSEQLDDGLIGVGTRFAARGSAAGRDFDLELRVVEHDPPRRIVLEGTGEGLATREEITVEPHDDGCEVTYGSSFETDKPDLVDALAKPAFVAVGKRAISGMRGWFGVD